MTPFRRKDASFALCGLNCCLCPRFHTDGPSRCPGCGGENFSDKHPSCSVITCSKKHGAVEYCFECDEYPCAKYSGPSKVDSFMSYANVTSDFSKAKKDLKRYLTDLGRKRAYLTELISDYNDGKAKGFYCLAVDLLPLAELESVMKKIKALDAAEKLEPREKTKRIREMFEERAKKLKLALSLRKPS